jgi:hypothetical protein
MSNPTSEPSNDHELPDDKGQVEQYRQFVLEYEQLDEEIDTLLERNHGGTEDMSKGDYQHYKELAARRDDVYNEIKALEATLLNDDDD